MKSRQQATAERPPAKRRRDRSPRLGRGSAGGPSRPTWRHRPGRARDTARSRLGFGSVVASVFPCKRGLRVMREKTCSRPIAAAASVAEIPMSVRSSPDAPNLMWGTDGPFGCSRWTTAGGWIFTAIEHWNAECRRLACVQARRPLRRPSGDLPWGLRGCMPRPPPVRRGGWPCGWVAHQRHGSQYLSDALHRPDQVLGHPAVLRLRRTPPDQRRRREVQSHAQGTDHP